MGHSPANRGKGYGIRFLREHVNDPDGPCLIWPLSRNPNGYAMFGFEGVQRWAHRYMCELANGPPPTPDHEAAHSCGNGHEGCVHPRHLSWKTISENLLDCRGHGTQIRNPNGPRGRLTKDQVAIIRSMKGGEKTQAEIAEMFGVSQPTIRDIFHGRSHGPNPKIRAFMPDEDLELRRGFSRSATLDEIAEKLGRTASSVRGRAVRLGLM